MSKKDGGPAFPVSEMGRTGSCNMDFVENVDGMSLRDYFAGQALAGLLSYGYKNTMRSKTWTEAVSAGSFSIADSMIKERKK